EGPSVLMGTAIGKGSVSIMAKKHPMWSRYSMTGGACAGFAVATGASVSGVMFAIEEAHQRISPMILLVGVISVLSAQIVSQIICPLLGLSLSLFPSMPIITLAISDIWVALVVGVVVGLFAVVFLKYYYVINNFCNERLKRVPHSVKIFIVYALTLVLGIVSFSFISTGHEIFSFLLEDNVAIFWLVILLLVRVTLTLLANTNKLTGGVFVPILAIGALLASIVGKSLESVFGLSSSYYTAILVLGIAASVASMMKMPLTAIVFALEVFGCVDNLIFIIVAVAISCIITEIFGVKGMNDNILENIVKEQEETHERKIIDTYVTIKKGSFAENMHSKDILWPANFFLLSISKNKSSIEQVDQQGEIVFSEGDILHVRYATFDEEQTKEELNSIVGEQNYDESEPITS
ncbi:MAG: chloride channel protein, partial [Clostridia bacterium]|nr:chloride channel protein [Clostridia bacterium]